MAFTAFRKVPRLGICPYFLKLLTIFPLQGLGVHCSKALGKVLHRALLPWLRYPAFVAFPAFGKVPRPGICPYFLKMFTIFTLQGLGVHCFKALGKVLHRALLPC